LALTLNGKKRKIKKADFVTSMQASGMEEKVVNNIFAKFAKAKDRWFEFIDQSFLPDEMKEAFKVIIAEKLNIYRKPHYFAFLGKIKNPDFR